MASADILRIIRVGDSKEQPPDSSPLSSNDGAQARNAARRRVNATAKLALWPGPHTSQEIVTYGEPVPLIHVDGVVAPERFDPRIVLLTDPSSKAARSYRLLRHRLFGLGDPRTIAVTSARAGEGKTTCAVNLALALAEDTTSQVLLLETNLRHPIVGRLFGFEPYDSVLGAAIRSRTLAPPYPITGIVGTRLHLAALASEPIPGARLDRAVFASLLSDLREVYDYVIIDAGPVLESGDADIAGECANGVIVTARTGKSRKPDFRRAVDQLRPTPVFGTVLFDA
jgi:Mrp family chromosome partitioning ATPase